jgi:hypothetical protein
MGKIIQNVADSITMAGVTLSKSIAKILGSGASASNYQTFLNKGVAYQVPAGKTLRIWAMLYSGGNAAGGGLGELMYGDTIVGNSASPPTNVVNANSSQGYTSAANERVQCPLYFEVPAGKYPCYRSGGSGAAQQFFLCEEV